MGSPQSERKAQDDVASLLASCGRDANEGMSTELLERLRAGVRVSRAWDWPDREFAFYTLAATAYQSSERPKEQLASYRRAEAIARALRDRGDPSGPPLILAAMMGVAAAHLALGALPAAETTYGETARLAAEFHDPETEAEALRMQAHCVERQGDSRRSWDLNWAILKRARQMSPEQRARLPLSEVGDSLLELSRRRPALLRFLPRLPIGNPREALVRRTMSAMLGPSWNIRER